MDLSSLKDKSVIITGGASGMGLATAQYFARAGAYVTIADLSPPPPPPPAGEGGEGDDGKIKDQNRQHISYVHCDVLDFASQVAAFKHAVAFGPQGDTLDFAALFAGVAGTPGSLVDHVEASIAKARENDSKNGADDDDDDDEDPAQVPHIGMDINLAGEYDSAYLALHYMGLCNSRKDQRQQRGKSILMVSSMGGYADMASSTDYSSAKFGVRGMFRSVRHRSLDLGVRINLLAPWYVDTPMVQSVLPALDQVGIHFTWAPMEHVLSCVAHCAVDETVHGRGFIVMPEGYVDLDEEEANGYGGETLAKYLKLRRADGDSW